jgi:L-fuculose-phosphate aldolase
MAIIEVCMSATTTAIKREMCDTGERMWRRGYCAGNDGNISVRLPGAGAAGRVLATPTGVSKGFMTPEMMVTVDPEGRQVGRAKYRRTSEILLHVAIYRARADVGAVIHAHLPHATAFACSGVELPGGVYPEAEVCLGTVPTVPYSKSGYGELAATCVKSLREDTNAMLLGNHGAVTFGTTLTEAYYRLEMLEAYCQILLLIKQIGQVRMLTASELAEIAQEKRKMGLSNGHGGGARTRPVRPAFFEGCARR